jgi:hypothetical protein
MSKDDQQKPTGALFFEDDGSVKLYLSSDIEESDRESITMASNFFQYALQQEDWLRVYLDTVFHSMESPTEFGRKLVKSDLRLIKGGMIISTSGSKLDNLS